LSVVASQRFGTPSPLLLALRPALLSIAVALTLPAHASAPKAKKPSLVKRVIATLKAPPRGKPPAPASAVERLGRGYQLYADGQYDAARKELAPLKPAQMHNPDYLLYLLGTSELLAGDAQAARAHFHDLALLPGRFQTMARWRVADCDYEAGRLEDARKGYESVLGTANELVEPAVARFRIGEALQKRGSAAAAEAQFRKVYVGEPLHPLAEVALGRLQALHAPPITAEERIARAKILTANRAWPRALDELALVPADVSAAVRDEADYWIGTTKFKMRRDYDLAAKKLLGLWARLSGDDRKAEALFHGARAWSRADQDDEAQKGYRELINKYPRSKYSAEASFLIGWLDFNRGKYKEAIPELEDTLRRYGTSQFEDDARWHLGFSRWLGGDVQGALADFEKLAAHAGGLIGGKGGYWRGRALVELGRVDEAKAVWRALINEYPLSYYALQARVRLKDKGVEVGPFGEGARAAAPPLAELDPKLTEDSLIRRVDELAAAGMTVEAGVELRRGEGDFLRRYGAARALPVLFDRYLKGSDFHRPHQLAETYSGVALRIDPHGDALARKWWELVYPRAYREYVEKYAPTGDNPPYYLYTVMQKESAYNPHDVSYADAIGLLQMIPPTSRRVAPRIDATYTDDVLYDPEGNIRFGAWYIGHLLQKFKGQIALGAGSYNAGPKAMMKWIRLRGSRPLDEFIELCPYTQTREYMKKTLDIYSRYVWLYDKQDYLPDQKIDTAYLDNDIDY
jgi:soluble lytic murein transglycosylase